MQVGLETKILASALVLWFLASVSASRHSGLGFKFLALASKFNFRVIQLRNSVRLNYYSKIKEHRNRKHSLLYLLLFTVTLCDFFVPFVIRFPLLD